MKIRHAEGFPIQIVTDSYVLDIEAVEDGTGRKLTTKENMTIAIQLVGGIK